MKVMRVLFSFTVCVLLVVIAYSSFSLWEIQRNNAQEAQLHSRLLQYRPTAEMPASSDPVSESSSEETSSNHSGLGAPHSPRPNQGIIDLQVRHPDVVGWLTIPNTGVDYPFAQGKDNAHYLHLDLEQKRSAAGTIFMDFRNSQDFSDFNTILFGHHMRNGSMFGSLQAFNSRTFFEENRTGMIFLPEKTYEIDFFAFAVIAPDDAVIFDPTIQTEAEAALFLDHVEQLARYYRDINLTVHDRLVTLSTCNYEFDDARMVLVGRLSEI